MSRGGSGFLALLRESFQEHEASHHDGFCFLDLAACLILATLVSGLVFCCFPFWLNWRPYFRVIESNIPCESFRYTPWCRRV